MKSQEKNIHWLKGTRILSGPAVTKEQTVAKKIQIRQRTTFEAEGKKR